MNDANSGDFLFGLWYSNCELKVTVAAVVNAGKFKSDKLILLTCGQVDTVYEDQGWVLILVNEVW